MKLAIVVTLALICCAQAQVSYSTNQLTTSVLGERAQRGLFTDVQGSYVLPITTGIPAASRVSNAAGRQLQADKSAFPFLATLPNQGSAVFLTVLSPCGLIVPHIHMRATEQYLVISGQMQGVIAEENGGRQNISFTVNPGQTMVVPQGLVHANINPSCKSNVFVQIFNSADPGTIALTSALSSMNTANPLLKAANITTSASQFGAFALDTNCLAQCGLSTTQGGGFGDIEPVLQTFLGLSSAPAGAPAGAPSASSAG